MKKIKLLLIALILTATINAQFISDIVNVVNPQNNIKEVVTGYCITIYFDEPILDSLSRGIIEYNDSTSYIMDAYKIFTKGIGDTTFIMSGIGTYNTTDYDVLKSWQTFINEHVIPAKHVSDSLNYYQSGYKTARKPYN